MGSLIPTNTHPNTIRGIEHYECTQNEKQRKMINIHEIMKLTECSILTGYVKNKDRGINLLLIADAESGKSEVIEKMINHKNILYTNDLSYKGLIDDIIPKLEHDEVSHILIPDFINPLSHRRASETLIPALNSLLAEGIKDLKFYGSSKVFSKKVRGCIITAVTKEIFDKKIIGWRDNGFLSRVVPLTFSYANITQEKIHNSIKNGEYLKDDYKIKNLENLKLNSLVVEIPENISDKVEILAKSLVNQNKSYSLSQSLDDGSFRKYNAKLSKYGFRLHKQLRSLLQGIAVYNQKKITLNKTIEVTEKDFNDLYNLSKFMSYDFTQI